MGRLDQAGLEALYRRLETPLYNVVYRWVWSAEDARDLVQEAFVRLWRMRARVDMERVEPLVYRIALNLAANRRRSRNVWRWVGLTKVAEPEAGGEGADEGIEARERRAAVRRAVETLPEKYRRVVMLSHFAELSQAQVAEVLGIPAGTVASRKHKAMALLRRKLGGDDV